MIRDDNQNLPFVKWLQYDKACNIGIQDISSFKVCRKDQFVGLSRCSVIRHAARGILSWRTPHAAQ